MAGRVARGKRQRGQFSSIPAHFKVPLSKSLELQNPLQKSENFLHPRRTTWSVVDRSVVREGIFATELTSRDGIEMSSLSWKNNRQDWVTDRSADLLCGVFLVFSVGSLQNISCRTIEKSSPKNPFPSRWHCRHNVRTRKLANNFWGQRS